MSRVTLRVRAGLWKSGELSEARSCRPPPPFSSFSYPRMPLLVLHIAASLASPFGLAPSAPRSALGALLHWANCRLDGSEQPCGLRCCCVGFGCPDFRILCRSRVEALRLCSLTRAPFNLSSCLKRARRASPCTQVEI